MKSILLLNFNYYLYKKGHVIKQFIIFAICSILIIIQSLSVYNLSLNIKEQQRLANGSYDAVLIGYNTQTNSVSFNEKGLISIFASVTNQNAKYNNKLYVGYADKNAERLACLQLSEGRFPEKSNEIAIEKSVSSVYRKSFSVGDKILLPLDFIDETHSENKEFIICGILENYSKTQWKKSENSLFPQILVSEIFFSNINYTSINMLLIAFTNNYEKESVNNELIQSGVCENMFLNSSSLLDLQLKNISAVSTIVLTVFTGVISISLSITNILLSKNERLNKIGLYRIIGCSNSDIIIIFQLREAIPLLLGVIIGSISGVLIFNFLHPANLTSIKYNIGIITLAAVFVVLLDLLLLLISVIRHLKLSIVEQLKPVSHTKEVKDIKTNIKNPILLWAWKNYNYNKYAASAFSLFLTVVMLFNITAAASLDFVNKSIAMSSPADIEISAYNGAGSDFIGVPENIEFGVTQEDCDYILDTPVIDRSIVVRFMIINIKNALSSADVNNPEYQYWISDSYKEALKKYGYEDDIYLNQDFILAVNNSTLKQLESQPGLQGKINYEKLNSCEEVILCNAGGVYKDYSVGDTINLTQIVNNKKYEFNVTVGAIINFQSGNYFESMESWAFGDHMVWGNGSFEKAGLSPGINMIYLALKNIDRIDDLDEKLNNIASIYGDSGANCQFSISEHYQQTEQFRVIRKIINTGYIFIMIIIMFFVVISSIVTLQIRIEQQRKALASMRAVGLKEKQMFEVMFIEKICQLGFSFVLSTILSVIIIFLVNKNLGGNYIAFPLSAHVLLLLILIMVISIAAYIPVASFYKKTITSQLRD